MRTFFKSLGILVLIVLALSIVLPLVWPVPPLQGVQSAASLADADSRFVEINGVQIHYKQAGSGEPAIILLHGFAASTFSWREVYQPLSQLGQVVAYDRPGQGFTQRLRYGQWQGANPYALETQPGLLIGLMDSLGIQQAILVGNSAGGTVALMTALQYPGRVRALVLVDAAIYNSGSPVPDWLRPLLFTPQASRIGPYFVRSIETRGMELLRLAWHDPAKISPDAIAGYRKPLQVVDWDKGLWELTRASRRLELASRLKELRIPVLVVTGDDDRIVPTADSVRLAQAIGQAEAVVIKDCGHTPQEECPQAFLQAVEPFIQANR